MHLRSNELKQKAKGITVAPERLGTDVSMRQQMLDEELLEQWPNKGIVTLRN